MTHKVIDLLKRFLAAFLCIAAICFPIAPALALTATPASDSVSRLKIGLPADHEIKFRTPSGVNSNTDTVTLSLPDFVFGSVGVGDIDLFYGPATGLETVETLAAAPGVDVWGVQISGNVVTFTAPINAGAGYVPAADFFVVRIGLNAVGGTHQLTNPASAMSATVTIGGTFGDSNILTVPIVPEGSVVITASVISPTSGGGGGGSGGVIYPPVITNVVAIPLSMTSVKITWTTDKAADSNVAYGLTIAHTSGTSSNASLLTSHSITLTGLSPNTTYHFSVSSMDATFLSAMSPDATFTTALDVSPPVISHVHVINITDSTALVLWDTNEAASSLVSYGLTSAHGLDATVGGYATSHTVMLSGLSEGTLYHYVPASTDPSGNSATGTDATFTTLSVLTPISNVTNFIAAPGDTKLTLTWTNSTDTRAIGTQVVRKVGGYPTTRTDGLMIYDGPLSTKIDLGLTNGTTYYYAAYAHDGSGNFASGEMTLGTPTSTPVVPPVTPPVTPPSSTSTPPVVPPVTPPVTPPSGTTPGTTPPSGGSTTTTPAVPPPPFPSSLVGFTPTTSTVPITVSFYGSSGTILLVPDPTGTVGSVIGAPVVVSVPISSFAVPPTSAGITVGGLLYSLQLNADHTAFVGSFSPSLPGLADATTTVIFPDKTFSTLHLTLNSLLPGHVVDGSASSTVDVGVPGSTIQLYREVDGTFQPYGDPKSSDNNGGFAIIVPNGKYYALVKKSGFVDKKTDPITVSQNVFNPRIPLQRAPKVVPTIPIPVSSLPPQVQAVIADVKANYEIVRQALDLPQVQQANQIAAPALLAVTVANTASAVSLFNLFAYLQFIFTQPMLLFGLGKRKKWGVVYNSLSKMPVDLSIVRLVRADNKLTVQSKVTDKYGRFAFIPRDGTYLLQVVKPGYTFPTQTVTVSEDAGYSDVYHGEPIVTPPVRMIINNVPLDPATVIDTPQAVLWKAVGKRFRDFLGFSGIPLGAIVFAVTPSVVTGSLFVGQVAIYVIFRRLAHTAKPKSWGMVYDARIRRTVPGVVVRIFEKKFNKLLETQVTDATGKYGFLVRRNVYYITAEKKGYKKYVSPDIDLSNKDEGLIDQHIALEAEK